MRRYLSLIALILIFPSLVFAQGTMSVKDLDTKLTTYYYTKTATDALLDDKASTASVALKANTADVNTTAEITALLADKADTASVAVKADKTYVDATDEILAAGVASKANSADVYTTAAVDLLLLDKADTAAVAVKADKTYVDGSDEVFLAHTNATSGAHAASAISSTNWTNVQTCIDSIENAINGIITGSGFATGAWVNATVENALTSKYDKTTGDSLENQFNNTKADLSGNYSTTTQMNTAIAAATAEVQYKYWYPANMVNGDYTGEIIVSAVSASQTQYNAVYMKSDGWAAAKADSYTTLPAVGIILETGTGSKKVLVKGIIKNTSWSFTQGQRIYVSAATAGSITSTAPTTTGQLVQIIGIALAADTIYVCPDTTCVEN